VILFIDDSGAPAPAFWGITSWATDGSASTGSARYGWTFTVVGGDDLACSKLRANTSTSQTERVIIHRNSDNAIIAQADIVTPGANGWGDASVTPFVLVNGVAYTISTRATGGNRSFRINNTVTFDSRLGSISGVNATSGDSRPTNNDATFRRFCDFGA